MGYGMSEHPCQGMKGSMDEHHDRGLEGNFKESEMLSHEGESIIVHRSLKMT